MDSHSGNRVRAVQMHTELGPAKEPAPFLAMLRIMTLLPNLLSKLMVMWRWLLPWVLRCESNVCKGDRERAYHRSYRSCGGLARECICIMLNRIV